MVTEGYSVRQSCHLWRFYHKPCDMWWFLGSPSSGSHVSVSETQVFFFKKNKKSVSSLPDGGEKLGNVTSERQIERTPELLF